VVEKSEEEEEEEEEEKKKKKKQDIYLTKRCNTEESLVFYNQMGHFCVQNSI
jgi:hypothetical protein